MGRLQGRPGSRRAPLTALLAPGPRSNSPNMCWRTERVLTLFTGGTWGNA